MFTHFVIGAEDMSASRKFYDAALGALGHPAGNDAGDRVAYASQGGMLLLTTPIDGKAARAGNGITIGFAAPNVAAVEEFYSKGIAAGGSDAGAPGPRDAIPNSFAAYLRDPTGNKIVAWCVKEG